VRKCAKTCVRAATSCQQQECRLWMEHAPDLNCSLVAIQRHGSMTLHEVADRLKMSYVRVKQIQDEAIEKIDKDRVGEELFVVEDGSF